MATLRHVQNIPQDITEAGGEFAASRFMRIAFPDYQIKYPFKKGGGVNQIWVRRDVDGDITEYLIVEAKGMGVSSIEATLSPTLNKGHEMSPQWVLFSLWEMQKTTTNAQFNVMAGKIIDAIEKNKGILVWGVCLTEQADRNCVKVLDCGVYNMHPQALEAFVLQEWKTRLGL